VLTHRGEINRMLDSGEQTVGGQTKATDKPDSGLTSPTLLDKVRDWGDRLAWLAFFERYNPMLLAWCHRFGLDGDAAEELCQRIWVELMARMQTFRYDPSRGFRRWLWRLCRSRAIDFLRRRRATQLPSIDDLPPQESRARRTDQSRTTLENDERCQAAASALRQEAKAAQEAVRSRVDADTWRAYWIIAIEDRPVQEAADSLGKKYSAVYHGYRRVDRMLRQEGERRLAKGVNPSADSAETR
jgi:RNA polymerase sigma-70 factor, ECF subfamily